MQIVVLGMHRSGTSAVTGMLVKMGAYFGPAETALPCNFDNPRGFWERLDVVKANDELLAASNADWLMPQLFDSAKISEGERLRLDEEIGRIAAELTARPVSTVKDPRLCVTHSHWIPKFPHPVFLIVHRNPLAIARSLQNRNKFGISTGLALWEFYLRSSFRATLGRPCVLLDYDVLMASPEKEVIRLRESLNKVAGSDGLSLPTAADIAEAFDGQLRHHTISRDELAAFATPAQLALADAVQQGKIESIATDPVSAPSLAALNGFAMGEHRIRVSADRLAATAAHACTLLEGMTKRIEVRAAVRASRVVRGSGTTPDEIRLAADQMAAAREDCLAALGTTVLGRIS